LQNEKEIMSNNLEQLKAKNITLVKMNEQNLEDVNSNLVYKNKNLQELKNQNDELDQKYSKAVNDLNKRSTQLNELLKD